MAGIFSFGGGAAGQGLLALAGGLQGAGQGVAEVGRQQLETQHKMDLAAKMEELALKRETTMERLRHGHEMQTKQFELRGQSAIAQYKTGQAHREAELEREFQKGQQKSSLASGERRTERASEARENAAMFRADAVGRGKGPGKDWEVHSLKLPDSFDPVTHQPIGGSTVAAQFHTPTGRMFIPVGPDKFMPYVATSDGRLPDPGTTRRVDARAVQDLVNDPTGRTPNGNPKSEVFLQRNGFLPSSYFAALQAQQRQGQQETVTSRSSARGPAGNVQRIGGGTPGQGQSEGNPEELNAPEQPELPPLPGEEEEPGGSPGGDGGRGAYSSMMQ